MSSSAPFYLGILTDHPPIGGGGGWPEHAYPHLFSLRPAGIRPFLFAPSGIDLRRGTTAGWTADPAGAGGALRWLRCSFPLPDAVYNRISRRRTERSRACRRLLERLGRRAPLFNPRFLGKWEVHTALLDSKARSHLPQSLLYEGPTSLFDALRRFGSVYVKPVDGSLGRRIARIEGCGRRFRMWINAGDEETARFTLSARELARVAGRWYAPGGALVQERIPLLRWEGLPFDLRVLLQRLPSGAWALTGIAGRRARQGAITTHTVRGGERLPFSAIAEWLGGLVPSLDRIEAVGVTCANAIEEAVGLRFFELSFDAGFAADGRLFVFEVNSKPFPFDEEELRAAAAERLFDFARAAASSRLLEGPGSALGLHQRGA